MSILIIGSFKSFFAVYMLCKALQAGKTVIFHCAARTTIYIFDPNKSRVTICSKCPLIVLEKNTLYMYDADIKHKLVVMFYNSTASICIC
jgi:hypothetical protein